MGFLWGQLSVAKSRCCFPPPLPTSNATQLSKAPKSFLFQEMLSSAETVVGFLIALLKKDLETEPYNKNAPQPSAIMKSVQ